MDLYEAIASLREAADAWVEGQEELREEPYTELDEAFTVVNDFLILLRKGKR